MAKRFDPFDRVSCRYGAPMGRHDDNLANVQDCPRLFARHQGGGDGYDKGGAYWGLPSNVWAVWGYLDGERMGPVYVRANGRDDAIRQAREGA